MALTTYLYNFKKIVRYTKIYGLARTWNKTIGRNRSLSFFSRPNLIRNSTIGLIGCGQFQFSTIAFFLSKSYSNKFLITYDTNSENALSLARYYKIPHIANTIEDFFNLPNLNLVYIASNHSSHTDYSIQFLNKGIAVYCEKPISVTFSQLDSLISAIKNNSNFYAGYNRPYSKAISYLSSFFKNKNLVDQKFTLSCFVTAHNIPHDHWYRNDNEGTRICGNVGHWLDLMIHVFNWRGYIPTYYKIQICYSNLMESDDNIVISIATLEGDLFSVVISARSEPFEGINETINFQCSSVIAKIDDFRRITIWDNDKLFIKRFFPKDVGHKRSIMQPFSKNNRILNEVISSTELMLHITEMVRNRELYREIELNRYI